MNQDPNYTSLRSVLDEAYAQAATGKGKERHAGGQPFEDQPMQVISDMLGSNDGMAYQAIKKIREGLSTLRYVLGAGQAKNGESARDHYNAIIRTIANRAERTEAADVRLACEIVKRASLAAPAPAQAVPLTDGELWSWTRSVMSQGADIRTDYDIGTHKSYAAYSARLDAAAAERATALMERITGEPNHG